MIPRTYIDDPVAGISRALPAKGDVHGLSIAAMHRQSLERFPFDSVLLPYNFRQMQDERYAAEFEALAGICAEGKVAMQTIKSIALAPWDGRSQTASTWYEPLNDPADRFDSCRRHLMPCSVGLVRR